MSRIDSFGILKYSAAAWPRKYGNSARGSLDCPDEVNSSPTVVSADGTPCGETRPSNSSGMASPPARLGTTPAAVMNSQALTEYSAQRLNILWMCRGP